MRSARDSDYCGHRRAKIASVSRGLRYFVAKLQAFSSVPCSPFTVSFAFLFTLGLLSQLMSRTSSTYVSPNLGPTAPWGQQTSTGVFRPPPSMTLNPGIDDASHHDGKSYLPSYPAGTTDATSERGHAAGLASSYRGGNGVAHARQSDGGSRVAPSPSLQSKSPPFHPHNHYGNMPAALPLTTHNLTTVQSGGVEDVNGGGSAVSADRLMKMISYSVHREEDAFLAKKESNRVLEKELQREQELRRETQRRLEYCEESFRVLHAIFDGQSQLAMQLGVEF